jgi:hypothetical protein
MADVDGCSTYSAHYQTLLVGGNKFAGWNGHMVAARMKTILNCMAGIM